MANEVATLKDKVQSVRGMLEKFQDQIASAAPKHLPVDKVIRISTTAMQRNPMLFDCTQASLFGAVVQSTALGLTLDPVMQEASLVPFRNKNKGNVLEATLIIGYRGWCKLARQSGEVSDVEARAVHKGDQFTFKYGLDPTLDHVPGEDDTAETTHVYAVIKLRDGTKRFDVMSRAAVEKIRGKAPSRNSDAWRDSWDEMAKKTVLRRLLKLAPMSIDAMTAESVDDNPDADLGNVLDIPGSALESPKTALERKTEQLQKQREPEPIDVTPETPAEQPEQPAEQSAGSAAPTTGMTLRRACELVELATTIDQYQEAIDQVAFSRSEADGFADGENIKFNDFCLKRKAALEGQPAKAKRPKQGLLDE